MLRATIWISRGGGAPADSAIAQATAAVAPVIRSKSVLTNEHPRRIHHCEAAKQAEHDGRGREPRGRRPGTGHLAGELMNDLRDRPGAEPQAEHGDHARIYESTQPCPGD